MRSYFDVLNEIDNDKDKLDYLLAIINKQFLDEDPIDLSFISNLCYESQRHHIEQAVKGYKDRMGTDLLGNPLGDPCEDPPQGGKQGGYGDPPQQEEEKEKEKELYIKDIVSPPEGVDALHFYIAKSYHQMFFEYKGGKTLQESKVSDWVKTIRLLIEKDNVSVKQLIGIKLFLQAGINKERGVDTFWSDTIYSVNALRKKSKDGTFQIDRIKQAAKRWLDKNPEKETEIYKAEEKLMNKTNGR